MGKYLGEAYQVADDLLDCNGDAQVIGKPIGQDKELGRPNYVIEKGSSAASVKLRELVRLAEQSVPDCPGRDELQAKIRSESQSFVNPALGARQAA
jgi:geranylgeranyl diphosphate synthase type II